MIRRGLFLTPDKYSKLLSESDRGVCSKGEIRSWLSLSTIGEAKTKDSGCAALDGRSGVDEADGENTSKSEPLSSKETVSNEGSRSGRVILGIRSLSEDSATQRSLPSVWSESILTGTRSLSELSR